MEDLWPSDFTDGLLETAPVMIMREQGALLGQKTKHILEGEVVSHVDTSPDDEGRRAAGIGMMTPVEREIKAKQSEPTFYHSFYIKVPSLGNYRYRLFYVRHPILLYPAVIYRNDDDSFNCQNEAEFKGALRSIFYEDETMRIISTLLQQSTSLVPVTS